MYASWKHWGDGAPGVAEPNGRTQILGAPVCLCATLMARGEQLKKALPIAIWLAWTFAEVSLYAVDFNRHTRLERWALYNLELHIKLGNMKYYACRGPLARLAGEDRRPNGGVPQRRRWPDPVGGGRRAAR